MERSSLPTALITGGGRGIGAALAKLLSIRGYRLVLVSRSMNELENTKRILGTEVEIISFDLSKTDRFDELFDRVKAFSPHLDVLVNNAGWIKPAPFEKISEDDWDYCLKLNLKVPFMMCQKALAFMKNRPQGASIINISSLAGIQGLRKFPGFVSYSAAKAGLVALTENLAVELKPLKIRVNVVAPGATDTQMLREALPGVKADDSPELVAKEILDLIDESFASLKTGSIKALNHG